MSENVLHRETSPYLLQHKDNPVHWRAWGPEALEEAKRTGKPILLSIGYAACHWCHVMAHESFEDEATAAVMNELFVSIKVDREERPDVDAIYMGALHRLGQPGGWPLTMFLDADARPFWGGTYFPNKSQWGRPAFVDVLRRVAEIYRQEPDKVANNAEVLTAELARIEDGEKGPEITDTLLRDLVRQMVRAVDPVHGGVDGAPKFPQWSFFWLLWRGAIRYRHEPAKAAVETTLVHICQGGIYDHLGGGFARYSVDERWLVPHFEKMLYDNALLIDLMTEVWRETKNPLFEARVAETVDWLCREMIAEGGGFAASLDADSEGEEGKFYLWSRDEIAGVLGAEDGERFAQVYDVTRDGNFEGRTILNRLAALEPGTEAEERRLARLRHKLLEARASRVRPGWDDKVLADWNGLMIAALARAARVFRRPDWLAAAERAFSFIDREMSVDGRLLHSWRGGRAKASAAASDYANMIWAALRLYEATANEGYVASAQTWTDVLERHYWLAEPGGYAMTADDARDIIVRMRSAHDDATPNANAVMISNLAALSALTGQTRFWERAGQIVRAFSGDLARNLLGHAGLLSAAMDLIAPQHVVIVAGEPSAAPPLEAVLGTISLPGALEIVVARGCKGGPQGVADKVAATEDSAAYVCSGPQCSAPIHDPEELRKALIMRRAAL